MHSFPVMKTLDKYELQKAEEVLKKHLPKSYKVYGFLYSINRRKPTTMEVVVDSWPDFKVIICRPDLKNSLALDYSLKVTIYSTDEQILRKMLTEQNAVDWSLYFYFAGLDVSSLPILREVSISKGTKTRNNITVHLLHLPDSSNLVPAPGDSQSQLESRISSLSLSHVDLVNNTWKFGGNEQSYRNIKTLITHFPSCCITDEQGHPVSWLLVYNYCAMGILYTLPEHRGKGYARVLVSTMAKRLHAEGYPVYCFIEEDNTVSYRLFKNLGFIEDPSYKAVWLEVNF